MEKVIFKNLTNVRFKELKNAISKDKLRPAMMGVFLDVPESKIIVTNGHVLACYDVEIMEGEFSDIIIDPKIFNQQTWLSVPKEDLTLVEFHISELKTEVFLGEELVAVANNIPFEQPFPPNWKSVLNNTKLVTELAVDAKLMKQGLSAIPEGFPAPKIEFGNKVLIKCADEDTGAEFTGLVMPSFYPESKLHHESKVIEVNEGVIGRKTSQRVMNTWSEDFADEDTGEIVTIERSEVIIETETELTADHLEAMNNLGIMNVRVLKQ